MTTRYPGVTSFTDSNLAQQLFFGRTEDEKKLFYCILSESLTVLYSKSGYGKTSLLQAGVFKMLRDKKYYPFYIRFNKKNTSPEEIIKLEIAEKISEERYEITGENKEASLEKFFNDLEIWSPENKLITPVLVFDQFEEIFTLEQNYNYRTDFIGQLSVLLREAKEGRLSIKIVLSLREDYLGHLENLAIKIPSIFSNRFRLEALSREAAKEAIVQPGEIELKNITFDSPKIRFEQDALDELLDFLSLKFVEKQWVKTDEIEPAQLQIICSTLEERAINIKGSKSQTEYLITKEVLGGRDGLGQILGSFYNTQLDKLAQQHQLNRSDIEALQHLIEEELIINGKRVPKEYESILANEKITESVLRSLIDQRLLKVENFQSNKLVEISHDTLVEAILLSKETRLIKEEEERRIKEGRYFLQIANKNINSSLPQKELEVSSPANIEEWNKLRYQKYIDSKDIFLVHTLWPSDNPKQKYDIYIYLIPHRKATTLDKVKYAEFFLGRYWRNKIFRVRNTDNKIGIYTAAYGSFLCMCRIVFNDDSETMLYRYIDFEQGKLFLQK